MKRQGEELESLKATMEARIKNAVAVQLKSEMTSMIREMVTEIVKEKVREEVCASVFLLMRRRLTKSFQLDARIPNDLRESSFDHQRQMLQVQTDLHNSEARRYNASLQSPSINVPLRPLLRPVPTPEQSPYPILVTSATDSMPSSASALPIGSFPTPPAPSPIKRSKSLGIPAPGAISRSQSLSMQQAIPQTPSVSELFPRDLKALFALSPDATRTLLRDYGLQSVGSSPVAEEAKHKAFSSALSQMAFSPLVGQMPPSPVQEESDDDDVRAHMEDMNTFMSHIGVSLTVAVSMVSGR